MDVTLEDPTHEVIYRQVKSQFDSHTFTTLKEGTYGVCFSNEFSTFSHKLVYMDFQVGDEPPLPGVGEHATVMTQVPYQRDQLCVGVSSTNMYHYGYMFLTFSCQTVISVKI